MKKLLIICILIVSIIFISGCTSDEQANSEISMSSQSDQESDTQNPGLIIKQSDVPGLALHDFYFISAPKSSTYTHNSTFYQGSVKETKSKEIPVGNRNVGQFSSWEDKTGRDVIVTIKTFDSNDGIEQLFLSQSQYYCDENAEMKPGVLDMGCGSPNIGDNSLYTYSVAENSPDVKNVDLLFVHGNYLVSIRIIDEKETSLDETIRIAKLVESRLD